MLPGNLIFARFVIGTSFFASPAAIVRRLYSTKIAIEIKHQSQLTVVFIQIVFVKPLLDIPPDVWGRVCGLFVLMDADGVLP